MYGCNSSCECVCMSVSGCLSKVVRTEVNGARAGVV